MESEVKVLDEALEEAMLHLVQIMRHTLGNILEEKNAIMLGHTQHVRTILMKRAAILDELEMRREKMSFLLSQFIRGPSEATLDDLASVVGSDKLTILSLRDQIVALADSIEKENARPATFHGLQPVPTPQAAPKPQAMAVLDPETDTDLDIA